MRKKEDLIFFWISSCAGIIFSVVLLYFLVTEKMGAFYTHDKIFSALLSGWLLFFYSRMNIFVLNSGYRKIAYKVIIAWSLAIVACIVCTYLTKTGNYFSRKVLVEAYLESLAFQLIFIFVVRKVIIFLINDVFKSNQILVVGPYAYVHEITHILKRDLNENAINLSNNPLFLEWRGSSRVSNFFLLDDMDNLKKLILSNKVSKIYLAIPWKEMDEKSTLFSRLVTLPVETIFIPMEEDRSLFMKRAFSVDNKIMIPMFESPTNRSPGWMFLKSVFDHVVALTAILILSPVFLVVALTIKVTSEGPVIFKQIRHGIHGKPIIIYKFRSMYQFKEAALEQAVKNDRRVTKVGRFIRKKSIDELPQLFNVLFGDISLVGPRPHPIEFDAQYAKTVDRYMTRHRVKPGITGLAQINGARGETETVGKMKERIEHDLYYIINWSFMVDIKILIKTFFVVFRNDAY